MSDPSPGAPQLTEDERLLAELGYKQELERSWGGFTNFAISFSIISILAGCFTNFFAAWNNGGPVMVSIGRSVGAIDPTDTPDEHRAELERAREHLTGRNVEAEFVPAVGEPADTIVMLAEERDADLIVVGTREPNVLERLLGQSVSQSVSRQAHCDVLIVH